MGIKGLNTFIKKQAGSIAKVEYISKYRGKRIIIDAHNWMYRQISGAQKRTVATTDTSIFELNRGDTLQFWVSMALNFIMDIIGHGVTPVFVFDGKSPYEKTKTKADRQAKLQKVGERIRKLREEMATYDILSVPREMTDELNKLYTQDTYVTPDEKKYLKDILQSIGIPVVQAKGEAEKLCALLCIEGVGFATYSNDTDTLACGCPVVISEIGGNFKVDEGNDRELKVTYLGDVLRCLNLDYASFVDLCIMAGNDFNENISFDTGNGKKKKSIAVGRSYPLILQYKYIEEIIKHDKDVAQHQNMLNYQEGRRIFGIVPSESLIVDGTFDLPDSLPVETRNTIGNIGEVDYTARYLYVLSNCPKARNRPFQLLPNHKHLVLRITKV